MSDVLVAIGYNNTGELAALVPAGGRTEGIQPGRFTIAGDGHTYGDGYMSLVMEYESLTAEQMDALLSQFGLTGTTRSKEITLRAKRNHDRELSDYNGIVSYPNIPRDGRYRDGYWRDVRFRVTRMTPLEEEGYY